MVESEKKILCDFWYAQHLPEVCVPLETAAESVFGKKLASILLRRLPTRLFALIWCGRRFPLVAPNWYFFGRTCALLFSFGRPRRLVFLECIDFNLQRYDALFGRVYEVFARHVLGPALQRSASMVQVMSEWERANFVSHYGLTEKQVVCVKWPLNFEGSPLTPPVDHDVRTYVSSSGRAACDWKTLFEAARLGSWPLIVVCAKKDLSEINALNHQNRAAIYCDIPLEQHNELLRSAAVSVICLKDEQKSSGQVRLGAANIHHVPAVVTRVRGVSEHLIDGVNGLAVDPRDADELANKINVLWGDINLRRSLSEAAASHASKQTKTEYFAGLAGMLKEALAGKAAG